MPRSLPTSTGCWSVSTHNARRRAIHPAPALASAARAMRGPGPRAALSAPPDASRTGTRSISSPSAGACHRRSAWTTGRPRRRPSARRPRSPALGPCGSLGAIIAAASASARVRPATSSARSSTSVRAFSRGVPRSIGSAITSCASAVEIAAPRSIQRRASSSPRSPNRQASTAEASITQALTRPRRRRPHRLRAPPRRGARRARPRRRGTAVARAPGRGQLDAPPLGLDHDPVALAHAQDPAQLGGQDHAAVLPQRHLAAPQGDAPPRRPADDRRVTQCGSCPSADIHADVTSPARTVGRWPPMGGRPRSPGPSPAP